MLKDGENLKDNQRNKISIRNINYQSVRAEIAAATIE